MEFYLVRQRLDAAMVAIDGRVADRELASLQFRGAWVMAETLLDEHRPANWLRTEGRTSLLLALQEFALQREQQLFAARDAATAGCEVPR
jgi:hypothetical protein